ncbi:MAG: hypothetical protein E6J34_19295 [Chloroflexi bacterium]|nr:MAG: hypothetical protein E6J34_19295 [Chloroflexota bacterium]
MDVNQTPTITALFKDGYELEFISIFEKRWRLTEHRNSDPRYTFTTIETSMPSMLNTTPELLQPAAITSPVSPSNLPLDLSTTTDPPAHSMQVTYFNNDGFKITEFFDDVKLARQRSAELLRELPKGSPISIYSPFEKLPESMTPMTSMPHKTTVPMIPKTPSSPAIPATIKTSMQSTRNASNKRIPRCIWCDNTSHLRNQCSGVLDALEKQQVYFNANNRLVNSETSDELPSMYGYGGMRILV